MIIYINGKKLKRESFIYNELIEIWITLYKPFERFREILQDITGFYYPSGFALISKKSIIENIYIAQEDERGIHFDTQNHNRFILINNYAGAEGGKWSWKGLTQSEVEKAFNIKFDNKIIEKLGGFPSNMMLFLPA
jgi:hypothetical protein